MIIRKADYNDVKILNKFLTLLIKDERQYDLGINENFIKGIATSLIDYFKKWAVSKNAHKIEVNVWSNNIKAKHLYEKNNFKTTSETLTIDNL